MRKALLAFFMVLCLCVCGCDSQQSAPTEPTETDKLVVVEDERINEQKAEDLVDEINALVLGPDIEDELDRIEEAYEALPSEYKDQVTNYGVYETCRADYDSAMQSVDDAIAAIDAIGTIDENSMPAINSAQAAYNSVNPAFSGLVTNASVLDTAVTECKQAISDKGVADTQALIDAGRYQDAYNYASNYLSEHMNEINSQSDLTKAMQTAEIYWAWQLYEQDYVGYTQDILDHLTGDAVSDGIKSSADELQARLDNYLASIEPYNGTITDATISGGYGELNINSGSSPLLVKVEDVYNPGNYIFVYVRANSTATINVPDGSYYVKYSGGGKYFGDKATEPFGSDTWYKQANDTMQFTTSRDGSYITYSIITLTLYAVQGGNMGSTTIDGF